MLGPNQKLWVAALRSGNFAQHKGILCSLNGYCCLGVACEIVGTPKEERGSFSTFEGEDAFAPNSVVEKFKLRSYAGDPLNAGNSLASLNDSGSTFSQIADLIESDPLNWFTGPA